MELPQTDSMIMTIGMIVPFILKRGLQIENWQC